MDEISKVDIVSEAPDFSMFALFMQADIVVKSVIIILISILTSMVGFIYINLSNKN